MTRATLHDELMREAGFESDYDVRRRLRRMWMGITRPWREGS
jgi:hypothetical protein